MINANELRIGNFIMVVDEDSSVRVTGIWDEVVKYKESGEVAGRLKPIPLSPEILEACGFEKTKRSDQFKLEDIIIGAWEENEFVFLRTDGYDVFPRMPLIRYLHQLQNLYFALTGKELQINL